MVLVPTRVVLNVGDIRIAQGKRARCADGDERGDECQLSETSLHNSLGNDRRSNLVPARNP
jgi:hypothetical protein